MLESGEFLAGECWDYLTGDDTSVMNPIDRVAHRRRNRTTCLYCTAPASTDEHVIAKAIGGRLKARILCADHNGMVGATADKPFTDHYSPLTFAANVPRQGGEVGTSVRFVDAGGRATTVAPDGRSEYGLHGVERNEAGVVQRASGALKALKAIARGHPDPNGFRLFEVVGPGVTIPIAVGIGPESLPGYLKAALHFAAGFVNEPPAATIAALQPGIFRERPVRALMQLPFRAPYFDPNGPIRHEVTVYPDGPDAIATVMVFTCFCVTVSLPRFGTRAGLRYVQLLDGTGPQLVDVDPIPIPREPLSDREWDCLLACSRANIERIFHDRHARDIEEIAQQAGRVAMGFASIVGMGRFVEYFRAELERSALDAEAIDALVRQARAHIVAGRGPIDISPMLLR